MPNQPGATRLRMRTTALRSPTVCFCLPRSSTVLSAQVWPLFPISGEAYPLASSLAPQYSIMQYNRGEAFIITFLNMVQMIP